jgi:hypothetical protein
MTTLVVPDAPADPEAAALNLIVQLPIEILDAEGLRSVHEDQLDGVGAATGMRDGRLFSGTDRSPEVVFYDSGAVALTSERALIPDRFRRTLRI